MGVEIGDIVETTYTCVTNKTGKITAIYDNSVAITGADGEVSHHKKDRLILVGEELSNMRKMLVVNYGEHEFNRFEKAISTLQEEYGYEGLAWDMVVASGDLEILAEFLLEDGIEADIVEE